MVKFSFDSNKRKLNKIEDLISMFDRYVEIFSNFSADELKNRTTFFKNSLSAGKDLDEMIPETFALVSVAINRTYGIELHKEQLLGAVALHQGRAVEMKTGEGKTLTAILPAYLNALSGQPVQIMTANNYLAKRDSEMVKPIFDMLGLNVGYVDENISNIEKKNAYKSDVVYGTVSNFAFDYLKDNMVNEIDLKVGNGFGFAIVDEADSVLIDQANTPLIISDMQDVDKETIEMLKQADEFVKSLQMSDYVIDKNSNTVSLEESGIEKAGRFFNIDFDNTEDVIVVMNYIQKALDVNFCLKKDKDYVVKFGEVVLVDSNTGRPLPSHKFREGIQQAIEVKEGLEVRPLSKNLATTTVQDFLSNYKKLSGMSGTLKNAEEELETIYKLDVVQIPTHKEKNRIDHENKFFVSSDEKYNAIIKEVVKSHKKGQPVLIGTSSVKESERLSNYLTVAGIAHNVLNAKNSEEEAGVIANSGRFGEVTIATDMAGRGTDIKLGGDAESLTNIEFSKKNLPHQMLDLFTKKVSFAGSYLSNLAKEYREKLAFNKKETIVNKRKVEKAGGLNVIIASNCASKRIEEQFRGRAGRQGDIGESSLYCSYFGEMDNENRDEKLAYLVWLYKEEPTDALKQEILNRIDDLQKNKESNAFASRKLMLKLNAETSRQNKHFYSLRNEVLKTKDLTLYVEKGVENIVYSLAEKSISDSVKSFDYNKFYKKLDETFGDFANGVVIDNLRSNADLSKQITRVASQINDRIGRCNENCLEKDRFLKLMDESFVQHLNDVELLQKFFGIHTFSSGNPFRDYEKESHQAYEKMLKNVLNKFTLEMLEKQQSRQNINENEIEK